MYVYFDYLGIICNTCAARIGKYFPNSMNKLQGRF